jgi:hypothetical protein
MTPVLKQVREWRNVDVKTFSEEIAPAYQPAVLRGIADHWPAVAQGRASPQAIADYLKTFDRGSPVELFFGAPQIQGRFFYRADLKSVNFQRRKAPLAALIDRLLSYLDAQDPPGIYAGAVPIPTSVPEFETHNRVELLPPSVVARIWIGNAVTVWTHYDLSSNIACVVAGRRRFTLFPPHQVANMYVGPLEFTLAGQPVSLVDLEAPDYDRYPRFREALEHAQVAELGPGDALFIPHLWWHHVKSLDRFNVLVNYWWDDAKPWAGSPFEALVHALLSIRDLPPSHRQAWRTIFEHYIFQENEDPAAHIPEDARGVLGPLTPELAYRMKVYLMRGLGKKD